MALKGMSKKNIAKELNDNHILTPSLYQKEIIGYDFKLASSKWSEKTIDHILKNATYTGTLVQVKKTRISHKTHNFVTIAEEDWIIYKNHHKAIIPEDIFNQVQDILYKRNIKTNNKGDINKYNGFIKCPDCGNNMYRLTRTKNGKKQIYYYCGTYIRNKQCTGHYILESEVDKIVIDFINKFLDLICDTSKKIEEVSISRIEYNNDMKKIKLIELEKEIDKYKKLLDDLINDYKLDLIIKDDFEDFNTYYMYELNNLRIEKEEIENKKTYSNNLDWLNRFKKLGYIDEINRNVANAFISNVYVYEDKNIEIQFRYKDQFEELANYLKI